MYDTLIDSASLQAGLQRPDLAVIDCRFDLTDPAAGRERYRAGHIPGAVFADLESDLSDPAGPGTGRHPLPDAERMREVFSRLGIGSGKQVVVYDDMAGAFAARLWWMLRYMDHDGVAVLDGGWQDWLRCGYATETGERQAQAAEFHGQPRTDRLLGLAAVPAVPCLVDSRDPVRYRGEKEPLDPVAGHIPGAVNRFWRENVDEDGCFRDRGALRREFLALLGDSRNGDAGFYCGSGVTACHNLLAAVHAGLPLPRLYAGSWSQWCDDPARPAATGAEPGPPLTKV